MWKKFAVVSVSALVMNACAGPAPTGFEAARQSGLNQTSISQGACDNLGQLLPGANLPQQALTVGPRPVGNMTWEASAAPKP